VATGLPRLLIASGVPRDEGELKAEAERFGKMEAALRRGGVVARHVAVGSCGELAEALDSFGPDMLFSSFFRFPGPRSGEAAYLREIAIGSGLAWIGSYSDTMELALSKPRMKTHWRLCGIPTPDWFTVRKFKDGSIEGLELIEGARDFPYIVKPAEEGNSRGIDESSVARRPGELYTKARLVAESYGEALVERFVSGGEDSREFTVAMIGDGAKAIIAPVEIKKAQADALVVSEADKETQATNPVPIEEQRLKERVSHLARRVFAMAQARDYARCDILLHEGKLYAIEMNGQPMVPDRWFSACAADAGLDEAQYLNAIVLASMTANARSGYAFIPAPPEMRTILPAQVFERLTA